VSSIRHETPPPRRNEQKPYAIPYHPAPIDLRLDANEGPPPPRAVIDALATLDAETLRRYPNARELECALASRHGVEPERVVATAGADGAIDRICRAFLGPGRDLILPVPTFEMVARYADFAQACTVEVDWPGGPFPTEDVRAAAGANAALIVVVSPNNPTGAVAQVADLMCLSEACPQSMILLDAAYGEFAETDLTAVGLTLPNVIITRTLSKAWGLAGLRVGYAIAPMEYAQRLHSSGGPYDVSGPSLQLALAALMGDTSYVERYIERVRTERAELAACMCELGGEPVQSQANFVLARVPNAVWLRDALAGLGIGVRIFPDQPKLASHVRITCPGDESSWARLRQALVAAQRPQAILFDLDGVLADVSGSYRQAIVETAESFGVRVTPEEVAHAKASADANNDWVVTQRLISARGVVAALGEITRCFETVYQGDSKRDGLWKTERLLPDLALLRRLRDGVKLGIVTGRPRRDALRFLQHSRIDTLFDVLVCMEDAPRKPDPAPVSLALRRLGVERAWLVGDSPDDLRAARAAGVVPLGIVAPSDDSAAVVPGLYSAGAARVLATLDELEELLP